MRNQSVLPCLFGFRAAVISEWAFDGSHSKDNRLTIGVGSLDWRQRLNGVDSLPVIESSMAVDWRALRAAGVLNDRECWSISLEAIGFDRPARLEMAAECWALATASPAGKWKQPTSIQDNDSLWKEHLDAETVKERTHHRRHAAPTKFQKRPTRNMDARQQEKWATQTKTVNYQLNKLLGDIRILIGRNSLFLTLSRTNGPTDDAGLRFTAVCSYSIVGFSVDISSAGKGRSSPPPRAPPHSPRLPIQHAIIVTVNCVRGYRYWFADLVDRDAVKAPISHNESRISTPRQGFDGGFVWVGFFFPTPLERCLNGTGMVSIREGTPVNGRHVKSLPSFSVRRGGNMMNRRAQVLFPPFNFP